MRNYAYKEWETGTTRRYTMLWLDLWGETFRESPITGSRYPPSPIYWTNDFWCDR